MLFGFLATLCAALFAGAAIYISLVEHPARLECGTELAATEFGPSCRRATILQASLAALGLLAGVTAWVQGARPPRSIRERTPRCSHPVHFAGHFPN